MATTCQGRRYGDGLRLRLTNFEFEARYNTDASAMPAILAHTLGFSDRCREFRTCSASGMAALIERSCAKNMGPGYPGPTAAGSADPGAQCADEQHMPPGAWNVKQGALSRVTNRSSGREDPRYGFNLSAMDRLAEGSEPVQRRLRAPPALRLRCMNTRSGSQSTGCRAGRRRNCVPISSKAAHAPPADASLLITKCCWFASLSFCRRGQLT